MEMAEFGERAGRLKARLYRTAVLHLGSESLALDAVDEAIYRGLLALRKLRQPEYFETWLTRILINECKRLLRRAKREQPLDALPEAAAEDYDALPLRDAILRLPPELKEVVLLRYFSGFTLAETARSLEIPPGTAATRQRRALQLLRLELTEED
ncbi:MAG: sigma-70 family RNA polymerase sigma factor [Oscillospiraceae bacterium]|jgi:RNA polymerase sigma-70 factor (ECF subfamily)|nr:sigma-70 family RNA polymerase sigma factor [Oscillospiraceae bacterium]